MGYLGRDVEVVAINPEQLLVASCDSCGAIGMKDLDEVQISWSITGRLTTRVAMLEVLATGAVPLMMTVAISNEPYPTGEGILEGVKEEFASAQLALPMAISTEKKHEYSANWPRNQCDWCCREDSIANWNLPIW